MSSYGRWGRLSVITGSNPISGSDISYTVPTGRIIKIHSIHVTMYANSGSSGTSRSPYIEITDALGNSLYKEYSGHDFNSGSGTLNYYWIAGLQDSTLHTGSTIFVASFPLDVMLDSGYIVKTNTTNLDDEDDWSYPIILAEEWNKDSI